MVENGGKKINKWEEAIAAVRDKQMVIVGYGEIGSSVAKIAKNEYGMIVTGVKRRPDALMDVYRASCDKVVGMDKYDEVIS